MNRPTKRQQPAAPEPAAQMVNPRWEAFALLVAKGTTAAEAYRKMYPVSRRWKAESVHREAHRLYTKVIPRVISLRRRMSEKDVLAVQEKLSMLADRARKAYRGLANVMTVTPDGARVINIDETNADIVKRAKTRIMTSDTGDGKDVAFVEVEVQNWLDAMKEHSRLAGHYPEQRAAAGADADGRQREDCPQIIIVATHATTGVDPDLDAYLARGSAETPTDRQTMKKIRAGRRHLDTLADGETRQRKKQEYQ